MSKASFFAALENLDDSDDEPQEGLSFQNLLAASRPFLDIASQAATTSIASANPPCLTRANTEPASSGKTSEDCTEIQRDEYYLLNKPTGQKLRTVKRSNTTGTMPGTQVKGSSTTKRKADALKSIPEERQLFKGLVFFFIPNDDIAPARRLRIQRAREYGAQWTRQWGTHITHVVAEKRLTYQNLIDYLKLEYFPIDMALVNENYPPECITYRSLLDPLYTRFQVAGMPAPAAKEEPTPAVEPKTVDSLPLKRPRREREISPEGPQSLPKEEISSRPQISEPVDDEPPKDAEIETEPRERDALDDIITESKVTSHLPLDSDSESLDEASDGESDSSESGPAKKKARTAAYGESQADPSWTRGFACMRKSDPSASRDNPNVRTIEVLQEMLDYYTRNADQWRVMAYRRAINTLRNQKEKIATRKQALALSGIGTRLADKIEEIVRTNHLRRLDYANSSPEDLAIQEFLGVYGAGLSQATKWAARGYRSLEDLRNKASLTPNQRIGVEHYHDFAQRIPRKEVEAHGAIVRRVVETADKDMQVIISGSYRRGARDSGDIDCLITKPGAPLDEVRTIATAVIVPKLFEEGFLQVGLATSRRHNDGSKWHGASCLPGSKVWRRIDLLFVPGPELGAALLYFTGNDIFNRSMRLLARKKRMCLNQHGLFGDVLRTGQVKTNPGRLLEALDERRIFALLGVPWRKPEERIC
ncbi:DNA polymerase family X [Penicillium manginii]|uniref:DNA polymerase family X n=1 Tax=Penicillium manginii TaxID=203109 RepID=UPI0025473C25|nr:DNA polymerase family X [Penicillium manginii]KAJ5741729.1 DNA polymerase family X [Penicillium manginii]